MSATHDDFQDDPIDLSRFDEDYARVEVRSTDNAGESIPDGHYETRIEEARLTRTPRTNNPMIVWRLRVLGPSHEGASLVKTRVITPKTLSFVKEDLDLLGIRLERFSDLEQHLGASLGREIRVFKRLGNTGWTDVFFARGGAANAAAAGAHGNGYSEPAFAGIDDNLPF
jgi:hypothetical protein